MNEDALQDIMNDERRHSSTLYTSKLGIGLNCFSSTLSAISSIALIVILLRSDKGLSTVYHRRIMSIAVATLVSSLAMAFSTLPMPKDMIYTAFEGIVAGNTLTCDIQFFFISLGSHFYYWFILILALYYVCRIVLNMSEQKFKHRIEVPMHIIAAVYSFVMSALIARHQISNPTPNTPPYCNTAPYPYWCIEEGGCDVLLRGSVKVIDEFRWITLSFGFFVIVSVIICLILTVIWVRKKKRELKSLIMDYDVSNDIDVLLNNNLLSTRAAFIQAMCYLLVYCIKSLLNFIRITTSFRNLSQGVQIFHCLMNPLDGFFNALIYVSIEVHNLRIAEASRDGQKPPILSTLQRVIKQSDTSNVAVISDLSIVRDDTEAIVHIEEEDGRVTESKCSVKGNDLDNSFPPNEKEYYEENQSNPSSNVSNLDDDALSYPSNNNISSGTSLSQNVSMTEEITANDKRKRTVIMDKYNAVYLSK